MSLRATASQTVGPYFAIGFDWLNQDQLAGAGVTGEPVTVQGRVLDGDGQPVPDAVLEIWQANAHGKYAHPEDTQDKPVEAGFQGFGRIPVDAKGKFQFSTIKPGRVPAPDGSLQAPHIVVGVFARGLLKRLVTRIYFPDDPANSEDFALKLVEPARRGTLMARKATKQGDGALQWDVVLQGPNETVFFDC